MDLVFPSNVKINDIFSIEVEQEEQRNAFWSNSFVQFIDLNIIPVSRCQNQYLL